MGSQNIDLSRLSQSPFLQSTHTDSLVDNFFLGINDTPMSGTRNRSQTYSGVNPRITQPIVSGINPALAAPNQKQSGFTVNHMQPASSSIHENQLLFATLNPEPFIQDDSDFFDLNFITSFDNPSLGPTNTLLFDNLPRFLDAAKLLQLLKNPTGTATGPYLRGVTSVRVTQTSNSKMALVVCSSIEVAMSVKASFNHLEIISGIILYVAFAKIMDRASSQNHYNNRSNTSIPSKTAASGSILTPVSSTSADLEQSRSSSQDSKASPGQANTRAGSDQILSMASALLSTVSTLAVSTRIDLQKVYSIINNAAKFPRSKYQKNFGPLPDGIPLRQFDSPRLRELRKPLEMSEKNFQDSKEGKEEADSEAKAMSQVELEELALSMLDELPELCYDHIGNTIIQKLFTVLESPAIKLILVKEIAPYFTQLGIHKNGTWAIQKIINLCQEDYHQKVIIAESLKPYSVKLFNDQFGNYVLQCCLKFGSPFNDFIFETICNNFIEISSGRFGVRCIRTILESASDSKSDHERGISNEQLYLIASLIVEHAETLVTNNNASLLMNWFLDTFQGSREAGMDNRFALICDKLFPHLEKLCTHKLASLTIFKILSNRVDLSVKQRIMTAIFGPFLDMEVDPILPPTKLLEHILGENSEHNAGPTFIYKVINNASTCAVGDDQTNQLYQMFIVNQAKRVLLEMNISNIQPYKKLLDQVGLPTSRLNRSTSASRKMKRGGHMGGYPGKSHNQNHHGMPGMNGPAKQYPMYNGQMGYGMAPLSQMPYQAFNLPYAHNGIPNSGPEGYQPAMQMPLDIQYQQDISVMRQLEELSISSASIGYSSHPGTPGAGEKPW